MSYGDDAGEARVVEDGHRARRTGPYEKLIVRGPSTLVDLRRLGLAAQAGLPRAARTLDGINAWVVADDEVLLVDSRRRRGPGRAATVATEIARRDRDQAALGRPSVIDVSSAYTILRLSGRRLPALMQELCPVDLSARAVADLRIVQAPVAGVRMVIARRDHGAIPGWILLVARDEAEYVWDAIVDSAGLRASTGRVLAVRPPAPTAPARGAIGAMGAAR